MKRRKGYLILIFSILISAPIVTFAIGSNKKETMKSFFLKERTRYIDFEIHRDSQTLKFHTLEGFVSRKVSIFNMEGEEQLSYNINGESSFNIDIRDLKTGLYIVRIAGEGNNNFSSLFTK